MNEKHRAAWDELAKEARRFAMGDLIKLQINASVIVAIDDELSNPKADEEKEALFGPMPDVGFKEKSWAEHLKNQRVFLCIANACKKKLTKAVQFEIRELVSKLLGCEHEDVGISEATKSDKRHRVLSLDEISLLAAALKFNAGHLDDEEELKKFRDAYKSLTGKEMYPSTPEQPT